MKPYSKRRKNFVRLHSRNGRFGIGYDRFEALCRFDETIPVYRVCPPLANRFRRCADKLLYIGQRLYGTDPSVFYQSPWIPKPHYDPEVFLPRRQRRR